MSLELIFGFLNKGVAVGVVSALMKAGVDLRKGAFLWTIFIGDLLIGVFVGYSMWVLMESSTLLLTQKLVLTFIMAINGFFVISLLMNMKFLMLLIRVALFRDKKSMDELVDVYNVEMGVKTPELKRTYPQDDAHEYTAHHYDYDYDVNNLPASDEPTKRI